MKRYLLFAGCNYYPEGGMQDFQGDFDGLDSAMNAEVNTDNFNTGELDWAHVYDAKKRVVVAKYDTRDGWVDCEHPA